MLMRKIDAHHEKIIKFVIENLHKKAHNFIAHKFVVIILRRLKSFLFLTISYNSYIINYRLILFYYSQ